MTRTQFINTLHTAGMQWAVACALAAGISKPVVQLWASTARCELKVN